MIRNYLITTFRNLTKHSLYTFINIAGLSLGISISLLIVLYVVHEFEQDRFHQQGDTVYQIIGHVNYGDSPVSVTGMSAQMGPAVLESNPEVAGFFRTFQPSRVVVSVDDRRTFYEGQFLFADAALLQTLTFPLVSGAVSTEPMTVVITERAAQKYFGNVDPVGKVITYDHEYLFQVSGVVENPPSTSSLQFDFIGSFTSLASLGERERNFFSQEKVSLGGFATYLVIPSPDVAAKVAGTIPALVNASGIENGDDTFSVNAFLDHSMQRYEASYTFTFLGIALAILALALINYVNLTTARATLRAKEVGIRK
ncbi:MAG: ABC transporter permease [Bacteroidia bacterium]|nr:ABC transporter permease [Bacteroidia bacterium]